MEPTIPEWFRDRNVLVTGATGFMGKVLVAKLLLTCPEIGKIFILIREKKDVSPQNRLKHLLQQEPFRILAENHPERLKKIIVVNGDTTIEGLGLSLNDKNLLIQEVSVTFHMAANVRFDLPLKTAVNLNTRGTAYVLKVVKQFKQLSSFIHVSTAYCQCGEEILEERAYPTSILPEKVFTLIDTMDDNILEALTPKLLGDQPNTYAFSKSLSEALVSKSGIPTGVARPSIVTASWKEPAPGWVDNMNGPTGLMIGAGKGVIRSMLCNPDYLTDIMPCDLVVNATITLAWKVGIEQPTEPIFMNITESGKNPISWRFALDTGRKHALENPFSGPLWYPGGGFTTSKIVHWFSVLFLHIIPAYLLDTLLYLTGNKPFLVKVQNRVTTGLDLLQYYTTKEWTFRNDMMKNLENSLSSSDRETFFMNTKAICWNEYILAYILGTRKYCLKDDPSTLPRARRVFAYLYVADLCLRIFFGILIVWFVYSWMVPFKTLMEVREI